MSSMILREFCEADAQEINRLAVAAFEEFGYNYSDWPSLVAFYGKISHLVILHRMWIDGTEFKSSSKDTADQPA
jgi:hypothetical protein